MSPWLLVAAGGAAGAAARFAVAQALPARPAGGFPWATFAVNVAGSLALGLVLGAFPGEAGPRARALLATGFCGAFTTFSTFGWEALSLLQARAPLTAAAYVAGSVLAGLAAVALGAWVGGAPG